MNETINQNKRDQFFMSLKETNQNYIANYVKCCVVALILLIIGLVSCSKQSETPTDNWTSGDVSEATTYNKSKLKAAATSTISATTGGTISQDGIHVNLPANIFVTNTGANYTGMVNLKLITLTKTEDAIRANASTMLSNGDQLITSGMFILDAMDANNQPLTVKPGASYTANINQPIHSNDKIFQGAASSTATGSQIQWADWPNTGIMDTGMFMNTLTGLNKFATWVNLDRLGSQTVKTHLSITLPSGFTGANTAIYMKHIGESVKMYIPAVAALKKFTTETTHYNVIEGKQAQFIIMAKKGSQFFIKVIPTTTIVTNHSITVTSIDEVTEAVYNAAIASF